MKSAMKSCVTIALVPTIQTGPWIYWDDLETSMAKAAALGFDAIELFTPSAETISSSWLLELTRRFGLSVAAVGTGAGKVLHGFTLTDPDPQVRSQAVAFIADMMSFGATVSAPAIIGSMQGNIAPGVEKAQALRWLADGLTTLDQLAQKLDVPLIYEPLNRYETNLINDLQTGVDFIRSLGTKQVVLLADLFHMNIEETSLPDSIRAAGSYIGTFTLPIAIGGRLGWDTRQWIRWSQPSGKLGIPVIFQPKRFLIQTLTRRLSKPSGRFKPTLVHLLPIN